MSTNYTENFDLCQWEPTDPVLRTDFNADNAKLEAALTALEEARTRLDRVTVNLAYYTGRLTAREMLEREKQPPQRTVLCDTFFYGLDKTLTGGAVIQNNQLILSGAGKTGTMATGNLALDVSDWTQARMWIHSDVGTVIPSINGLEMEFVDRNYGPSVSGTLSWEDEYVWTGQGSSSAKVVLTLSTGSSSAMHVYDYYAVLF